MRIAHTICACAALSTLLLLPAVAPAAIISPVTSGLLVGLDGDSALVNGSNRVQVWYDQVFDPMDANATQQDYGNASTTSGRNPLLVSTAMPNGSTHNVVDFAPGTSSTTNDFLDSKSGGTARTATYGGTFTVGADAAYSNASELSWFIVFKNDDTALASRTLWRPDFNLGHENVPGGTPAGPAHSSSGDPGSTQSTGGYGIATRDNVGQQFSDAALPASNVNGWFIVGGVFTADTGMGTGSLIGNLLSQDQTSYSLATLPFNSPTILAHVLGRIGGATNTTSSQTLDGKIAEILVFKRALSGSEYTQVESYLNRKYFVPEPSSWVMVLGSVALGWVALSRRRAVA